MENLLSAKRILNFNFKAKVFAVATVAFVGLVLAVRQPGWLSGGKKLLSGEIKPFGQSNSAKETDGYWAVYLDSGQVFYGKKDKSDKNYVVLSNVFYYHPAIKLTKSGNVRLVKVGTEIHQPQDFVYVSKVHIDRQEQLSADSKVVEAIRQYGEGK
ncbi:MAG: hypothetical protein AAB856_00035 [Patescibacteria group bacterium]